MASLRFLIDWTLDRAGAAERRVPPTLERIHDPLNTAVHSQTSSDQCTHSNHGVEQFDVPPLRHEAACPALCATVMSSRAARRWIEAFVFADGVALDGEAEHQEGWEGVCELHDAEGGDEAGEGAGQERVLVQAEVGVCSVFGRGDDLREIGNGCC